MLKNVLRIIKDDRYKPYKLRQMSSAVLFSSEWRTTNIILFAVFLWIVLEAQTLHTPFALCQVQTIFLILL